MKKRHGHLELFDLPFIPGGEAISGDSITNEFRRHIHQTFIIGLVETGCRTVSIQENTIGIAEGELFILNPGQVHACRSEDSDGHSYKVLSIPADMMQALASQISGKAEMIPYFTGVRFTHSRLPERVASLFRRLGRPESDIDIESATTGILSEIILCFSESPPSIADAGEQTEKIKRVCKYIQAHFAENLSLRNLSEIARLSPFHFQREFKKHTGITPHEYLSDYRISMSRQLLLETENIADTAIRTGFFDQSHFTRVFRKTVGIPPGNYIKNNK